MTAKSKDKPAGSSFLLITASAFDTLCTQAQIYTKKAGTATKDLTDLVNDYVKTKHLHKMAWGIHKRLRGLDNNKLSECLTHLDHYRQLDKLDDRAGLQGQLDGIKTTPETERDLRPRHLRERDAERTVEEAAGGQQPNKSRRRRW